MRRLGAITLLAALLLAVTAAASSAGGGVSGSAIIIFGSGAGHIISDTEVPFTGTGAITVVFHGDTAAGCAAIGDCAYSGTVSWAAASGGLLAILRTRKGHQTLTYATGFDGALGTGTVSQTAAAVERTSTADAYERCADVGSTELSSEIASAAHGAVIFQLLRRGGQLLTTRCAGPTDTALEPESQITSIPVAAALAGDRAVDLSEFRPFVADGYSGTIFSSVVLHLGTPHRESTTGSTAGSTLNGIPTKRVRMVQEKLAVSAISGSVTEQVSGASTPALCAPLDACASTGQTIVTPAAHDSSGELVAQGPASQPESLELGDLGLGGGTPKAISGFASVGSGQASATLTQDGVSCRGEEALSSGTVALGVKDGRLEVSYMLEAPLRDACPGPLFGDATLATGSVPARTLARRSFTVHLTAAGPLSDDGYTATLSGGLTITLRRGAITSHVETEPG